MIKILKVSETAREDIFARSYTEADVSGTVSEIIENVKTNGDAALFEYCRRFDKAELTSLEVSEAEFTEAMEAVSPRLIEVLKTAAENIRKFHSAQKRQSFVINDTDGVVMGQKIIPLDRAGLYVPGGTAAYPSTVLMDSIPAKIAGVDRIFKVGGAQAIAALAYGTESIPQVDKIGGPGNAFVAEASRLINDADYRKQKGEEKYAATLKPEQFNQIFIDAITTNHAPCPRKYVDYAEVFARWWWLEEMGFKDNLSYLYNMLKMRSLQRKVFGVWFKFNYRRYFETKLFSFKWYKYKLGTKLKLSSSRKDWR